MRLLKVTGPNPACLDRRRAYKDRVARGPAELGHLVGHHGSACQDANPQDGLNGFSPLEKGIGGQDAQLNESLRPVG